MMNNQPELKAFYFDEFGFRHGTGRSAVEEITVISERWEDFLEIVTSDVENKAKTFISKYKNNDDFDDGAGPDFTDSGIEAYTAFTKEKLGHSNWKAAYTCIKLIGQYVLKKV